MFGSLAPLFKTEAAAILKFIGADNNGTVSFVEFCEYARKRLSPNYILQFEREQTNGAGPVQHVLRRLGQGDNIENALRGRTTARPPFE